MQDDGKSFWRDSMLLWNVGLHTYQRQLLNEGWYTSGLLFRSVPWPHYSGNFFWAQSGYLSGKPSLDTLIWYWRYGAERWLLSDEKQFCRNYRAESIVKQFPFPPPGTSLHDLFSFVEFNKSAGVDFFCWMSVFLWECCCVFSDVYSFLICFFLYCVVCTWSWTDFDIQFFTFELYFASSIEVVRYHYTLTLIYTTRLICLCIAGRTVLN